MHRLRIAAPHVKSGVEVFHRGGVSVDHLDRVENCVRSRIWGRPLLQHAQQQVLHRIEGDRPSGERLPHLDMYLLQQICLQQPQYLHVLSVPPAHLRFHLPSRFGELCR